MYVYNENDLTPEQILYLSMHKYEIDKTVASQTLCVGCFPAGFMETVAKIHIHAFGGPRPNIKSGPGILNMLKNISNKLNKHNVIRESTESAGAGDRRSVTRKTEDGSRKRTPGRR